MEYIYSFINYFSSIISVFTDFIFSIPDFLLEMMRLLLINLAILYIEIKLYLLKLSGEIVVAILTEYGIYDIIEVSFNKLPPDVRYTLTAFGVADGFRIIFDVYASSLIMRFIGR